MYLTCSTSGEPRGGVGWLPLLVRREVRGLGEHPHLHHRGSISAGDFMCDLSLCVLSNKDARKQLVRLLLCVGEPRGKVNCHSGQYAWSRASPFSALFWRRRLGDHSPRLAALCIYSLCILGLRKSFCRSPPALLTSQGQWGGQRAGIHAPSENMCTSSRSSYRRLSTSPRKSKSDIELMCFYVVDHF